MLKNIKLYGLKSWFFLIVTVFCIFIFSFLGLLSQVSKSINISQQNNLSPLFQLLLVFQDSQKIEDTFNQIESEIIRINLPISNYLGISLVPKNLKPLLSELILNLKPLQEYQLTKNGFESTNNKIFTQDLSIFLNQLPTTLESFKLLSSEIFWYKNLLSFDKKSQQILSYFDKIQTTLEQIYTNRNLILETLGHNSIQKILILIQNPGEARPTGGFIGSYIPATINKGIVEIGQSQSIYWVDGQNLGLAGHPLSNYYEQWSEFVFPHGIRNMNYDTCIPSSLGVINKYFGDNRNGQKSDIIAMINPDLLTSLLPDNWNLDFENNQINSRNFANEIEKLTSPELGASLKNPKEKLTKLANSLIKSIFENKANLLNNLYAQIQARNLVIYFSNAHIQEFWSELELAGDQNCYFKNRKSLNTLLINLSGDKRDLVLSPKYSIYKQNNRIFVTFFQESIYRQNVKLQRATSENGSTFVGISLPNGAKNPKLESTNSINVIAPMPFYRQKEANFPNAGLDKNTGKLREKQQYIVPSEFEEINNSSYQIDGGFGYTQLDNSQVIGTFVTNLQDVGVTFSFEYVGSFDFFVQPALSNPKFGLGDGINSPILEIENKEILQKGVKIL
jgi:hypothetical protein